MNTVAVDAYAINSVLYAPLLAVCDVVVAVHDAVVYGIVSQVYFADIQRFSYSILIQFQYHIFITSGSPM